MQAILISLNIGGRRVGYWCGDGWVNGEQHACSYGLKGAAEAEVARLQDGPCGMTASNYRCRGLTVIVVTENTKASLPS